MNATAAPVLLVVDDSKMSRMMIAKFVGQLRPAWRLLEAASGEEAWAMISENPPDLVSMDVNMPGVDGLQVASQIRIHYPDIKIALCTANVQESMRQSATRRGIHFVPKPITQQSINTMIELFEA